MILQMIKYNFFRIMDDSLPQSVFTVKSCSKKLRIVTQCNNGPCPIIAIINCLILQDRIRKPPSDSVTAEGMMTQLGNYILNRVIPDECTELLHAQSTSLEVCSSQQLLKGLDINLKFKAVDAFEFTPMLTLFDFLDIKVKLITRLLLKKLFLSFSIAGRRAKMMTNTKNSQNCHTMS